jgi:serine/threonine protein kinase
MFAPGLVVAGRYRLEREIGRGGMGVVWVARLIEDDRPIALKVMHAPLGGDEYARRRVLREARAVAAVQHPNVVEVLDIFEWSPDPGVGAATMPVLAMEFLGGQTVAARLSRVRVLSLADTANLMVPIISAVGVAHARGIVHRDLKPENLFIARTPDGDVPKVLDFGIAKFCGPEWGHSTTLTSPDATLGTPRYMAPEQVVPGETIDHRADVWALGAILYECLTGACAVEGDTAADVIRAVLGTAVTPLGSVIDVPPGVASIVSRMLQRDPRERPTLQEVHAALAPYASTGAPEFGPASTQPLTLPEEVEPEEEAPVGVRRHRPTPSARR